MVASSALLDLDYLQTYPFTRQTLTELIEAFCQSTPPLIERLEQEFSQQHFKKVSQLCHTLIGAGTTVGAKSLMALGQHLAEERDPSGWFARLAHLKSVYAETQEALQELLLQWQDLPDETLSEPKPQEKIVLVEDNDVSRKAVELALAKAYQLLVTDNPEEALTLCEKTRPAAAIIDLNLGFSGDVTHSGLCLIPLLKDYLPVIVLTVDTSEASLMAATQAGAWLYLVKQPTPFQLRAHVASTIAAYRTHPHAPESPNALDLATGWFMATYHVSFSDARALIKTLASTQRRRIQEIVAQTLDFHVADTNTRELARRLFCSLDNSLP